MATRSLSIVQYGKETISTHGTAVAATRKLAAEIKGIPIDRRPQFIKDADGTRIDNTRTEVYEYFVEDTINIPNGYFQALPLAMSCGVKGGVTATETTGGQGDYVWDHTPSMTATNTLDSITLELADDEVSGEIEYVMFNNIKLSGEIPQDGSAAPVAIELGYFGRQFTKSAFTAAQALPTITAMNAKLAQIFKDTLWADKGETEVASTLRGFELEIMTGVHPKFMGSAARYFATHGENMLGAMLTLTLEGNAAAELFYDDFLAQTSKAYALKINGPQIGTGTSHVFEFYGWMVPESVIPLSSEVNGNNLTAVVLRTVKEPVTGQNIDFDLTTSINAI